MEVSLLDSSNSAWSAEIDRIGALLGAPDNPTLFPYHFLQAVLPRIGGKIVLARRNEARVGVGFLFPRSLCQLPVGAGAESQREYTLRYHAVPGHAEQNHHELVQQVESLLNGCRVICYDPYAARQYEPTYHEIGAINIGRPSQAEAGAIRTLHQQIWNSPPEFLYPTDIHSMEFRLGTSLVARVNGDLAGFLFGFYKFGGPALPSQWHEQFGGDLRLESQIIGVLPAYRGMRLGYLLKRVQAEEARRESISIIHWTVDPLQYPNAALNFGLLRAVAFDFYPDLYPFRNALNRVAASRFALTWLIGGARIGGVPLINAQALTLDLTHHVGVEKVNEGWLKVNYTLCGPLIAIEIPADWTALQNEFIGEAIRWREATDHIFQHYVGQSPGKYVITGVGVEGERRYLIGERADDGLWERLGQG